MGLRKHLNVTDDDDDEEDNVSNCEDDELKLRVGNGNFIDQKTHKDWRPYIHIPF